MTNLPAEVESSGSLSPKQEQAAFLDAKGLKRAEIATQVAVTEKTISEWRRNEAYIAKREWWQSKDFERIEGLFTQARLTTLDAYNRAVAEAAEMLKATKDDGTPDNPTRLRAIELLLTKVDPGLRDQGSEGNENGGGNTQVAVIVAPPSLVEELRR